MDIHLRAYEQSKFRSPHTNIRYLKKLFYEYSKDTCLYTLKDKDHKGFPSLYRLYMEEADLTEFIFAGKYLESWEHWQLLQECSWFKEYLNRWRTELELKIKAEALKRLQEEAIGSSKNSYNANRFLIEKGWVDKQAEASRRGRPSRDEITKQAIEIAFNEKQIKEDLERLNITREIN